ncbi:hypothetical protein HS1genome_2019 [Sulfodiicoccus acidiphilus]|uniref:Uncharacterized protein n=1 Tax=Sulfodiicoccus acidiphilus TaxID=1670455 RepID=A0A348B628_9CREN|nr:hypothetical protein HS1genome_2019 [Sulfodiicoccus acidiphilus]GGU02189.1 hypothetical protein GCM10007116_19160 [Sulfodiicoccus acidiphilus]
MDLGLETGSAVVMGRIGKGDLKPTKTKLRSHYPPSEFWPLSKWLWNSETLSVHGGTRTEAGKAQDGLTSMAATGHTLTRAVQSAHTDSLNRTAFLWRGIP